MGFLDRLLGREERPEDARRASGYGSSTEPRPAYGTPPGRSARSEDEIAIERYRYLLKTAPPEAIEQVHREAFEQLTPEQRQQVFRELREGAPVGDAPRSDDPQALAQSATRSELRQPGFMERRFSGGAGGMGFGGVLASSMLGTIAGFVIGSALADAFLPDAGGDMAAGEGGDGGDAGADGGDSGADAGGGDWGGDSGGDFGGGDFGGGDFGGGDFGGFDM
ncbi:MULTISPECIES: hypothetical protein [unclassified Rathayibacter]|uniref:hypothetical protein n=1 Tax=unclassified Rathayibacter TaxID=2609250 RepID=UPI0006FC685A|nr:MULTISPECIES: hypothetical protein [unclassified Rathayibacter]KQQ00933.1 hypothetical protein ASF42_15070 [Rathayibacter sp. Leaf294]KQS11038.1 hypothetical protein ASG06_15070 [Rathayibacter sp. Leaf185]